MSDLNDRRLWFFVIAAAVSAALTPPTPADLRWVPIAISCGYVLLALLVALDLWSRRRQDDA